VPAAASRRPVRGCFGSLDRDAPRFTRSS
jgi:hypothetical protein